MAASSSQSTTSNTRTCWTQVHVRRKNQHTQTCPEDIVVLPEEIVGKAVRLVDIFKIDLGNKEPRDIWEFLVNDFPIKVSTLKDELLIFLMRNNSRQYKTKLTDDLDEYLITEIENVWVEMYEDSRLPNPPCSTFMSVMERIVIDGK